MSTPRSPFPPATDAPGTAPSPAPAAPAPDLAAQLAAATAELAGYKAGLAAGRAAGYTPVPPIAPSDAGAPISMYDGDGRPTGHPLSWPLEYCQRMGPGKYREAVDEFERTAGGSTSLKFFERRAAAGEERRELFRARGAGRK